MHARLDFDTVDHRIPPKKLSTIGCGCRSLQWFGEYFSNRKQRVKVGNMTSNFGSIQRGIPQGSKVAPLLFALYLNDLPSCMPREKVTMYADDTRVECSAESSCELPL